MSKGSATLCDTEGRRLHNFIVSFCSVWIWRKGGAREGKGIERILELKTERVWLFIAGLDLESLCKGTWKNFVPNVVQLPW